MKIAVCQLEIMYEKKSDNYVRAAGFIHEASKEGADLILFPEMSFTGFSMNTGITGETEDKLETMKLMGKFSIEEQISIGFGWVKTPYGNQYGNERKSGVLSENHYTIINKTGRVEADYIKIHPFSYSNEDRYFDAGTEVCTFSHEGICFGLSICYDLRFPEIYQGMSENAHIILVPANWPDKRVAHFNALLRARAIENQVYMIGINCYGRQDNIYYSGNSSVISPNGDILFEIKDREAMRLIDIVDDVEKYREEFPVKKDRRIMLYKKFYDC